MAKFCTKCGNELTGKFCSNCGAPAEDLNGSSQYTRSLNGVNVSIADLINKHGNNKINAIKYVNEITNAGLRDSKDFVDKIFNDNVMVAEIKNLNKDEKESCNIPHCPKCNSTSITANKKGFGLGKAAVGGVLLGPVGLLAGMFKSNEIKLTCLSCGHEFYPKK